MILLIDECFPRSLGDVFVARGHEVRGVGDGFPSGSPDIAVLAAADRAGAVVISRDNDWKQLVRRQRHGERGQFQRAHRILINCEYHKARTRIEDLIEIIEFEYALHQRRSLQLIMRITEGSYRVDR
jgi:predicted nuclease of predicted toxin-antitoxin system